MSTATRLAADPLTVAARFAAAPDDWPLAPRFDPAKRWYHRLSGPASADSGQALPGGLAVQAPGGPDRQVHLPADAAASDGLEVWLLTWLPGQGTDWHDHGGSAGAFVVVSGELTEYSAGRLRGEAHGGLGGDARAGLGGDAHAGLGGAHGGLGGDAHAGLGGAHGGLHEAGGGQLDAGGVRAEQLFGAGAGRAFGARHIHRVVNNGRKPAVSVHAYLPALKTMTRYRMVDGSLSAEGVEQAGAQW